MAGALPPDPHLSNLAFCNCSKNVQTVIQMTLKWLLFSEKLQELPSGWGLCPQAPIGVNCYLAHNLHNQQLSKSLLQGFGRNKCCNDATITAKLCLTITKLTTIGYWLLFEKFKPPFKNFWVRPWLLLIMFCITFIKRLDEGRKVQLLRQNFTFLPGYTLKVVGKNLN